MIETQTRNILTAKGLDFLTPHTNEEALFAKLAKDIDLGQHETIEQKFIDSTIYAHLLLLQHKFSEVIAIFTANPFSALSQDFAFDYTHVVAIKQCAIAGTAYEALNDFTAARQVYESAAHLINDSIAKSSEALLWAELLYYRFGLLATSSSIGDRRLVLASLRGYQKISEFLAASPHTPLNGELERRISLLNVHFLYVSSLIQKDPTDKDVRNELDKVTTLFHTVLFQSTPLSATSSNAPIEQFVEALCQNWRKTVHFQSNPLDNVTRSSDIKTTQNLLQILRQATVKTFHSCCIMRNTVFVLSALGLYEEALRAFSTWKAYQEAGRAQRSNSKDPSANMTMDDDQSVVRVFAKAIDIMIHVNKNGNMAKETADKLSEWVNENESVGMPLSQDLSESFALVWASIGHAYALYSSQATTGDVRVQSYKQAVEAFDKVLEYRPQSGQVYFNFALLLAENAELTRALSVVQTGLLIDQSHARSWHLLGLILSALESPEKALQAVTNALNMCAQKDLTTASEKTEYLQLKMTQVAIYESSTGIDKALESIPEVFALYGELHSSPSRTDSSSLEPLKPTKSIISKYSQLSRTFKIGIKPSSSASGRRVSVAPVVQPPVAYSSSSGAYLLRLWLWTASLYRRAGLYKEAEEALVEAEKISGPKAATHVELGLLIGRYRPQLAMNEFETALEKDRDNIGAIVGLANLIFEHSRKGGYQTSEAAMPSNTNEKEDLTSSATMDEQLFLNSEDENMAVTRLQGLLDMVVESGQGFNSSEAWWLISVIRERNGNKHGAMEALWKSVELEESRSVRSYSVVRQ